MDVSYPDDSYPGSDVSYPLSVSSYPTFWSIRTQKIVTKFLGFLSEKGILALSNEMVRIAILLVYGSTYETSLKVLLAKLLKTIKMLIQIFLTYL